MATPVRTYFGQLRTLAQQLGSSLGSDIRSLPKDVRVGDAASLAATAVLCRALVDKGLLTNQDLQDAVAAAEAEVWPDEPVNP